MVAIPSVDPFQETPGVQPTPSPQEEPDASHAARTSYLFAFATRHEVINYVRTQGTAAERERLPEIIRRWETAQARIAQLQPQEATTMSGVSITNVPPEFTGLIEQYATDPLFQRSFAALPASIRLVEVDRVVAAQRTVNLDYVGRLKERLGPDPSFDSLLALCAAPQRNMDTIRHLEVAPNTHVFSSKNSDVRYLGSFMKEDLTAEEMGFAEGGGIPVAAVISFIGYGTAPISAFEVNGRCVLGNGFHRAYALRSMGITQIPMVVQTCTNPMFEFPPNLVGIPREYLLGSPRPSLLRDFFDPDLAINLEIRDRIRTVTVAVGNNAGLMDVPV